MTGAGLDDSPSTTTCWLWLARKLSIHFNVFSFQTIMMELHGESVMRDLVKGFTEIKGDCVDLLFVVKSLCQVIDGGDQLALTRTVFF